jgi:hypothetical protein
MTNETMFVELALRNWKAGTDRADQVFGGQSEEELRREIAPGKNRLIYIWGHLTAVNDALLPLLGFGPRLHPELDAMFIESPDRSVETVLSGSEVKRRWTEINESLWRHFQALTPAQWLERHNSVSEADFAREPHRNRFNVLLNRTGHLAEHLGQVVLVEARKQDPRPPR